MKRTIVLLAVVAAAGLLAACGGDDSPSVKSSATTKAPAATTPAATAKTIAVMTDDELGQYLVGPNGHTLYLFEKDSGTTSACTGGCVATWPALTAAAPSVGDGVDAGKVTTATGQVANQVAYNGHLLYYFSGDKATGDTNGLGIPEWYPVAPSGNKIDED
jgi:predicted lipoprotein with Yx(FWY)xxD motif